ncbi:MAG: hypothetical protein L6N96_01225 [Candidatus Methylarchaceae archaeon HK02M2]|nr:hypothetical protein [Candidatus Methylarchaceae archaeon HK02M2]
MAECVQTLASKPKTSSSDFLVSGIPELGLVVPQTYLLIECPCGEEHKIDLNSLTQSTKRTMQVEKQCECARHFIIHTGHPGYRKILIVSEFGDDVGD